MKSEAWVSIDTVAKHLDVSKDTVYRWINRRGMPAHKVGRQWKFRISQVDEWVQAGNNDERKNEDSVPEQSHQIVAESHTAYATSRSAANRSCLDEILREYKAGLKAILGDSLDRILLYGSQARGDATVDSDIDVLCVMRGAFDLSVVCRSTSELTASLSLKHDVVLSRQFAEADDVEKRKLPFFMNIRKESVPA